MCSSIFQGILSISQTLSSASSNAVIENTFFWLQATKLQLDLCSTHPKMKYFSTNGQTPQLVIFKYTTELHLDNYQRVQLFFALHYWVQMLSKWYIIFISLSTSWTTFPSNYLCLPLKENILLFWNHRNCLLLKIIREETITSNIHRKFKRNIYNTKRSTALKS